MARAQRPEEFDVRRWRRADAAIRAGLMALATLAAASAALAQDASCMARCQAIENQCLQQTKGDRAQCNAIATQCFQACRKQR